MLVAAGGVLLFSIVALGVLLLYIGTGNHGASLGNLGVPLLVVLWGGISALGVVFERVWAPRSFVIWGVASTVLVCVGALAGEIRWSSAVPLASGILLATVTVGWRPHAAH